MQSVNCEIAQISRVSKKILCEICTESLLFRLILYGCPLVLRAGEKRNAGMVPSAFPLLHFPLLFFLFPLFPFTPLLSLPSLCAFPIPGFLAADPAKEPEEGCELSQWVRAEPC